MQVGRCRTSAADRAGRRAVAGQKLPAADRIDPYGRRMPYYMDKMRRR